MAKFAVSCPVIAGAFPAAALAYRRGDIRVADPVVSQVLSLDDLFALKGSGVSTASALDELRARDVPAGAAVTGAVSNFDPLSFYVGRVEREFAADTARSRQLQLASHIDRTAKTVSSLTGELKWDWGRGLVTINTARTQGAAGFLSQAAPVTLGDVTIECANEYAAIVVISLDERPLGSSRKMLIQTMTEERPYGFRAVNGRIESLGSAPFGVRQIKATIRLKSAAGNTLTALDENGYARGQPKRIDGAAVELAPDSVYHILQRQD
jgi:hypothetical protein